MCLRIADDRGYTASMNPTSGKTFPVPDLGAPPAPLARGTEVPVRVTVRNVGPVLLFLAFATEDLSADGGPSGGAIELPVGENDVYVLDAGQVLFASSAGPGGRASLSQSDALPLL